MTASIMSGFSACKIVRILEKKHVKIFSKTKQLSATTKVLRKTQADTTASLPKPQNYRYCYRNLEQIADQTHFFSQQQASTFRKIRKVTKNVWMFNLRMIIPREMFSPACIAQSETDTSQR
jgi:hypothetical protein